MTEPDPSIAGELVAEATRPWRGLPARLELRRKITHMLPGLIPFVMWFIYHEDPLPAWNLAVVVGVVGVLTLLVIRRPEGRRRGRDEDWLRTCLTYAIPPVVMLICFPARAEFAAVVLTVLAFGDAGTGWRGAPGAGGCADVDADRIGGRPGRAAGRDH